MVRVLRSALFVTFAVVLVVASASAQADVIVGDLMTPDSYGSLGTTASFAYGTTSCNIGTVPLQWVAGNNLHPVIGQNVFRLLNGRFEHIGQSWLKHGFTALAQSLCSTCINPGTGSLLGVGCSDPYVAPLNGAQSNLGPKSEVNASTGVYPYPFTSPNNPSGVIERRLQIAHADLDPALNGGALYFAEGHYITQDDAAAGTDNNNASYRRTFFAPNAANGSFTASLSATSTTVRQSPGIQAWKDSDPTVLMYNVDVPSDGRIILAYKVTNNNNGTWHHEFAVQNLNSHRSVSGFSVPFPSGTVATNVGFHDVNFHSNEPFLGTPALPVYTGNNWPGTVIATGVSWQTEAYAVNQRANAIRWGSLFNFRFDANRPDVGNPTLELFRPGSPSNITAPIMPAFSMTVVGGVPTQLPAGQTNTVDIQTTNVNGQPDPNSGILFTSVNGAASYTQSALSFQGAGVFRATLPSAACFALIDWYVTINALGGGPISLPSGAPTPANPAFRTEAIAPVVLAVFEDTMNGAALPGYTVAAGAGLTDGAWDPAPVVPGVFSPQNGAPTTAQGGSGKCFVTMNLSGRDVDGGETRLSSPTFDLSGYPDARVTVWTWFDSDTNGTNTEDFLRIEISSNNGSTWTLLETRFDSPNVWVERKYRLGQYISSFTSQMKLRFIATDILSQTSIVEAGIDSIKVEVAPIGPYLAPTAGAGQVGAPVGGPFDVLNINGSSGVPTRKVTVFPNQAIIFDVLQPPNTAIPQLYAIFARVGWPAPAEALTLPFGIGTMAFTPCLFDPTNPLLFTLLDNLPLGICPPVVAGTPPGPTTIVVGSGFPGPAQLTLQGIIGDPSAPFGFSVTNGVILSIP